MLDMGTPEKTPNFWISHIARKYFEVLGHPLVLLLEQLVSRRIPAHALQDFFPAVLKLPRFFGNAISKVPASSYMFRPIPV